VPEIFSQQIAAVAGMELGVAKPRWIAVGGDGWAEAAVRRYELAF
jgi:hypothetical protein